ncbi:MAG: MerR family transcriptional regulator [Actinobacteria bacterium]|nr:MerR family transcriptional regulator [Actinomycetota bacterium]
MARMTIDELARRTKATTRNIRAYQDRGLLPPPEIVGRTGFYGEGHVARLNLIQRLLEQRFSLASIGTLLQAWESGQSLATVLGFEEMLGVGYESDPPEHVDLDELERRYGPGVDAWLANAIELGLIKREDDHYILLAPALIEAGALLVRRGVPLKAVLAESARLRRDAERIAERFNKMFGKYIWQPFLDAGRPAEMLPDVAEFLSASRPLPTTSAAAMVALAMNRQQDELLAGFLGGEPTEPIREKAPKVS